MISTGASVIGSVVSIISSGSDTVVVSIAMACSVIGSSGTTGFLVSSSIGASVIGSDVVVTINSIGESVSS